MDELKKYLTEEEIEKIKKSNGFLVTQVKIPEQYTWLTCDMCDAPLKGKVYALMCYVGGEEHGWQIRALFCSTCVLKRNIVRCAFIDKLIPELQEYFESCFIEN